MLRFLVQGFICDKASKSTHVVSGNGFNPIWNHTVHLTIYMPEVAVLLFTVSDSVVTLGSKVIAYYSIPISCIRTGYRVVPLSCSSTGKNLPMTDLFFSFSISPMEVVV